MAQKKILLVDDDLVLTDMVSEVLLSEGYEVVVEHDGEAGLAKALDWQPDVVVLDVMMPKITGLAVLEAIRATEWGKTVPALLMTNVNEPEAVSASVEAGTPVEYLLKTDWTIEQIVEKIKAKVTA